MWRMCYFVVSSGTEFGTQGSDSTEQCGGGGKAQAPRKIHVQRAATASRIRFPEAGDKSRAVELLSHGKQFQFSLRNWLMEINYLSEILEWTDAVANSKQQPMGWDGMAYTGAHIIRMSIMCTIEDMKCLLH